MANLNCKYEIQNSLLSWDILAFKNPMHTDTNLYEHKLHCDYSKQKHLAGMYNDEENHCQRAVKWMPQRLKLDLTNEVQQSRA